MAALAEYLKKYNSDAGPSVKQKKKKKEKRKGLRDTSGGLRIVDADVVWQKDTRHDSDDDEGENSAKNYVQFRSDPSDMWPEYLLKIRLRNLKSISLLASSSCRTLSMLLGKFSTRQTITS